MADFDFSTLVTDRSSSDLELLRDLLSTPMGDWTAEQMAAFNQAVSKGAYNYTDLNRVTQCMEYLDETLRSYGYRTGYQRIAVPHQEAGGRLPSGYTELQYIESTGTQYVDTGVNPNQDTGVILDYEPTVSGTFAVFGARVNVGNSAFALWITGETSIEDDYGTDRSAVSVSSILQQTHVEKIQNGLIYGATQYTHSAATFASQYSLAIFGLNSGGTVDTRRVSAKLYACEIYAGDTPVRLFVPCKNPSGEVGLYDTVTEQFYGNAGTGQFIPGSPINQRLPASYLQLEYIESTGTQYIDTGVSPNQDTRITMTAMLTEAPSEFAAFFGARTGGNSQFWLFWNGNSNIFQGRYGTATIDISVSAQQECVCDFDKNNLSINGTSGSTGAATFQSSYSAYLCGVNSSGALQYPASIRIYSCEIYNDGTLVRTFVPVKNEAGAVGLYDTTGKSFYANAGSGSFTAGPEVPAPEPEPTLDPYTWYEADIPTVSTMEAYLGNVAALRSVLTLPEDTAQVPGNMAGLTTTEANQIEEILSVIHSYLEAMITVFRRCGAAICGGPGFYFLN